MDPFMQAALDEALQDPACERLLGELIRAHPTLWATPASIQSKATRPAAAPNPPYSRQAGLAPGPARAVLSLNAKGIEDLHA